MYVDRASDVFNLTEIQHFVLCASVSYFPLGQSSSGSKHTSILFFCGQSSIVFIEEPPAFDPFQPVPVPLLGCIISGMKPTGCGFDITPTKLLRYVK